MFNFNSKDSIILFNGERLEYNIKKTRRRSLGLKISINGLTVHAPIFMSKRRIQELLRKKGKWIVSKIQLIGPKTPDFVIKNNARFSLLGKKIEIHMTSGNKREIKISDNICFFTFKENDSNKQLKDFFLAWLKKYALKKFESRIDMYCKKNQFVVRKVYLSNAKSRWGTCNSKADIRLNWRLIQAPLSIIDYVICHELCHLRYMNHSKEFWNFVGDIFPQYKQAESYLKEKGLALYNLD